MWRRRDEEGGATGGRERFRESGSCPERSANDQLPSLLAMPHDSLGGCRFTRPPFERHADGCIVVEARQEAMLPSAT